MSQSLKIWHNGAIVSRDDAKVSVMSHGLHYGSSVFEGIRVYDTPSGPQVFRLKEHIERLFDSAKIYRMIVPFGVQEIIDACIQIVKENNLKAAYIRPLIYYGDVGIGLSAPLGKEAECAIAAFPWGAYLGEDSHSKGIKAVVTSWQRLAPNTMPTGAKAGGNYLSSQLISMEAKRHGYAEGIALDTNGYVSEGAGENLFLVRKGYLITPPVSAAILPGLTREAIITMAKRAGLEVIEQSIPRESLYVADEIFMTGTATEVVPVIEVDGVEVGSGSPGPVTQKLQQLFFGLFDGTTQDLDNWLTPVK